MKKILPVLFFSFIVTTNSIAQPGSLDFTFSTDGIAFADLSDDYAYGMFIQSDGKIVMAGYSFGSTDYDIMVTRFNADGTLDPTFSSDGITTTDFGGYDQFAGQVAVQPDGKIVVGGTTFNGLNNDIMVVRYNTDGSLDNTFDSDGIAITDIGISVDYGRDIIVQSDGKILVAGSTDDVSNLDFAVLRYNSNGTLDNTFDGDGIAITDINSNDDYARSITLQTDGKIIVGGSAYLGFFTDFAAVRYNTDGSLDNTFSFDGKAYTGVGSADDYGNCVLVNTDGTVVVSGYSHSGTDNDFAVVRFTAAGLLDVTFDGDGVTSTPVGAFEDFSYGCAVQSDGKLILAGTSFDGAVNAFAILRYNTDGTIDNTFDTDGIVTTSMTGDASAQGVAVQTDGKIVAAGYTYNATADFLAVRYIGDCVLDLNVTQVGASLTADEAGATYQWVDCDNAFANIPSATNQNYTATSNGNYAVVVTENGCSDTSTCYAVSGLGFDENDAELISFYPNPTNGNLTLTSKNEITNASIKITDISGKIIYYKENLSGTNFQIDLSNQPAGIYFLELNDEGMTQQIKLVKN